MTNIVYSAKCGDCGWSTGDTSSELEAASWAEGHKAEDDNGGHTTWVTPQDLDAPAYDDPYDDPNEGPDGS